MTILFKKAKDLPWSITTWVLGAESAHGFLKIYIILNILNITVDILKYRLKVLNILKQYIYVYYNIS